MEQSKQLVSRELAERMKELGFEQESLFYWRKMSRSNEYSICDCVDEDCPHTGERISAYSVAELVEFAKELGVKISSIEEVTADNLANKIIYEKCKEGN